jgi:hypothetical protein
MDFDVNQCSDFEIVVATRRNAARDALTWLTRPGMPSRNLFSPRVARVLE